MSTKKIHGTNFKLTEAELCKYVSVNYAIFGSNNVSLPFWRYAIIWTNDDLLWIGPLGTNSSDIWIEMQ